jgi:O-antigen ligase
MRSDASGPAAAPGAQGWALIAVLWLLPLPLASNRIWAQGLWLVVAVALALLQIWRPRHHDAPDSALGVPRGMRLHMALLLAWTLWIGFQLLPLPAPLRALLQHSRVAGFPLPRSGFAALSLDPYSTRAYLFKALLMLLLQWLALRLFDNRLRLRTLVWCWLLAGAFEAALGVALFAAGGTETLFFAQLDQGLRAKGTFVYQNHFAGYMEMMLALGIGWMIALLGRDAETGAHHGMESLLYRGARFLASSKAPLRILLIVFVIALIASRSRMGNAAFFIALWGVGGATWLALRRQRGAARGQARALAVLMLSILVLDVAVVGGMVGVDKVVARLSATHLEQARASGASIDAADEQSVAQRIAPGLRALQMLADFPLQGVGGGSFFLSYLPYKPRDVAGFYDHAHDDYVEFAVESGAIGMLLLGALLGWSQWRGWRLLLGARSSRFERGMAFASVMGVSEILIHATVDFNLQNTTNAVLFLWLLGLPHWLLARRHRHAEPAAGSR